VAMSVGGLCDGDGLVGGLVGGDVGGLVGGESVIAEDGDGEESLA
jgi:hypothetical protein